MHIYRHYEEAVRAPHALLTGGLIRTPYVGLQLFQNDIRGQLEQHLRSRKDGQGNVESFRVSLSSLLKPYTAALAMLTLSAT